VIGNYLKVFLNLALVEHKDKQSNLEDNKVNSYTLIVW
jgi:hypothetical protein